MKYLLIVLSVIITLKLSAKEVIIDFNDPANFYEGYLFSNGIEGKALDISTAAYYRAPLPINQIDSIDMSGSFSIGIWVKSAIHTMD